MIFMFIRFPASLVPCTPNTISGFSFLFGVLDSPVWWLHRHLIPVSKLSCEKLCTIC